MNQNQNINPFAQFATTAKSRITVSKFVSRFDNSTKYSLKVRGVDALLGGYTVPASNAEWYFGTEAEVQQFINSLNSVGIY